MTNAELFLPEDYIRQPEPLQYDDNVLQEHEPIWQPEAYLKAAQFVFKRKARAIVEIGCGAARQSRLIAPLCGAHLILIDQIKPKDMPKGAEFIALDLDKAEDCAKIPNHKEFVYVCADVIEHLKNPHILLEELRTRYGPLVLSTPIRQPGDNGPPRNRSHVQEWTDRELHDLLLPLMSAKVSVWYSIYENSLRDKKHTQLLATRMLF